MPCLRIAIVCLLLAPAAEAVVVSSVSTDNMSVVSIPHTTHARGSLPKETVSIDVGDGKKIQVTRAQCMRIITRYIPNVDADGKSVIPADIEGSNQLVLPHILSVPLQINIPRPSEVQTSPEDSAPPATGPSSTPSAQGAIVPGRAGDSLGTLNLGTLHIDTVSGQAYLEGKKPNQSLYQKIEKGCYALLSRKTDK